MSKQINHGSRDDHDDRGGSKWDRGDDHGKGGRDHGDKGRDWDDKGGHDRHADKGRDDCREERDDCRDDRWDNDCGNDDCGITLCVSVGFQHQDGGVLGML